MVRSLNRLSPRTVAKPSAPGKYPDGGGLYFHVDDTRRAWVFRYQRNGRERAMGLGSARDLSLAGARAAAAEARSALARGEDPLALKLQQRAARSGAPSAPTFQACADECFANRSPTWRNSKHAAQWTTTIKTYCAGMLAKPVDNIDTTLVLASLEPIWTKKSETASRVRSRIERVLDFAKAKGHRTGDNPARWKGHLDQILAPRKRLQRGHHKALPFAAVPLFMAKIARREGVSFRALQFVILTACRTGEALGARWTEIDLEERVWKVPASRMKMAREHRVPLSDAAMVVLNAQFETRTSDLVFPSSQSGRGPKVQLSDMAMTAAMKRVQDGITVHGFRSSFRDWASETTDFPAEVCEMALAHVVANRVEAAYRRGDLFEKRRKLMDAWGEYCSSCDEFEAMLG